MENQDEQQVVNEQQNQEFKKAQEENLQNSSRPSSPVVTESVTETESSENAEPGTEQVEHENNLSESIVNIQSLPSESEQVQEQHDELKTENGQENNLSESIVNIPSMSSVAEQGQEENKAENNQEDNLTESIINIPSMPSVAEQGQEENKEANNQEDNLTESIINIPSLTHDTEVEAVEHQNQVQEERVESPLPPSDTTVDLSNPIEPITESIIELKQTETVETENDKNEITKSTVILTTSQIMHEENNTDLAELESINKESLIISTTSTITDQREELISGNDNNNLNTESMIVTNISSESSSFVSSPIQLLEKPEEEPTSITNVNENQSSDENLDKEYEIPNFSNSLKAEIDSIAAEVNSKIKELKSEKNVQEEVYQKILGNDSLLKKITEYGDAVIGRPSNGQMVTISYEAYLKQDSDEQRLVDHNENLSFVLGDGDVVAGLDLAVALMDKNEKCELILESRHAYGSLGKQPDIPSDATLVYKVHLKDFADLTDFNLMTPVERLSLAESKKLRGNFHYNRQDFMLAINSYKKGLAYFNEDNLRGDEADLDLEKFLELSQALLMNTALSYFKMEEYRSALEPLDQVLKAQDKHIKGLYIKGKVLLQLGETEEAVKCLSQALQLDPNNQDVKKELSKAQTKYKLQYENEKKMYQKMISGVSNKPEAGSKKISKSSKTTKESSSNYTNYLAAGLAVAVAVGLTLFARYKNVF